MRAVVLSMTFPNPKQPALGVFIKERMRRVAQSCEVVVVAPVPWFPLNRLIRGPQSDGIPAHEERDGLRVYHPPFFSVPRYLKWLDGLFYASSLVRFLARLRRDFPFDLIDAHFVYPDGVAAALLGKVFRVPVVITLRGSIVRLATYPVHRREIRWALNAAAGIISVSQSLKDVAVALGVSADKIRVIPNGVDTERFYPRSKTEARSVLGLPQDATILLSIGGLNEGKGFHRLIGCLPEILRSRADVRLVIVGGSRPGDDFRPALEKRIRDHGLERHVLLTGQRPHDEVPTWLAACDVFVLATRSEGWSNVLLEALACGRPVVATRVGGNPEIIRNDRLGTLVNPRDDAALCDAIVAAVSRPWDADELASYARQYSWELAASRVIEEFDRARGPLGLETRAATSGMTARGAR